MLVFEMYFTFNFGGSNGCHILTIGFNDSRSHVQANG